MKIILKIVGAALVVSLVIWIIQAALDTLLGEVSFFWNAFLFPHTHVFFLRIVLLVSFLLFGLIVGILLQRRQEMLAVMQETKNHYQEMLEHAADAIFVTDAAGNFLDVNPRACQMLGYSRAELLQLKPTDLIPDEQLSRQPINLLGVQEGKVVTVERGLRRSDGTEITVELRAKALPDGRLEAIVRDVTARRQAEEALRRSEARFRSIFEGANIGLSVTDRRGKLLAVNPALAEMLGYEVDELLTMTFLAFTHPDDVEKDWALSEQLWSGEIDHFQIEKRYIRKDGAIIWVMLRVVPFPGAPQGEEASIGMIIDITQQKQTEMALHRALRSYHVLGECNQALVRTSDEMALMQQVCQILVDVGGYGLAWVGYAQHDADKRVHPVAHAGYEDGYLDKAEISWADNVYGQGPTGRAIRTGQPTIVRDILTEAYYGPWREAAVQRGYRASVALPLFDSEEVIGALNIYSDVVDAFDDVEIDLLRELASDLSFGIFSLRSNKKRQKAEQALRISETRFRSFFHNAVVPMAITNGDGFIVAANKADCDFLGYPHDELIGMHFSEVAHPEDLSLDQDQFTSMVRGERNGYTIDKRYVRKDGAIVWGRLSVSLIEIEDKSKLPGLVAVVCQDITQRKKIENKLIGLNAELERRVAARTTELEAANERLEKLTKLKDEFVSNVSHELRTPITTIKLYHDLLSRRPDRSKKYLQRMAREIERLTTLIEDLLMLSRLDQDRMLPRKTAVSLNDLVQSLVEDRQPVAEARGIHLQFQSSELFSSLLDSGQIIQVVSILLTNALTYTPDGGTVTVSTVSRDDDGSAQVGVCVADTGPGIPPAEQAQIFERFYRGTVGRESGAPGTGLGLAIARAIMAQHQGSIEVASEGVAGRGARFTIWLPAAKAS